MPGRRDDPLQGEPRRDGRAARLLHPGHRRRVRRGRRDRAPGGMTLAGEESPSPGLPLPPLRDLRRRPRNAPLRGTPPKTLGLW